MNLVRKKQPSPYHKKKKHFLNGMEYGKFPTIHHGFVKIKGVFRMNGWEKTITGASVVCGASSSCAQSASSKVCVCTCVCIYIYTYAYIHYIYIYMYLSISISLSLYVYILYIYIINYIYIYIQRVSRLWEMDIFFTKLGVYPSGNQTYAVDNPPWKIWWNFVKNPPSLGELSSEQVLFD